MNYKNATSVTPSDSEDLTNGSCSALLIGGAGDIVVTPIGVEDGEKVTLPSLQAGQELKLRVKRVWDTDTTATNIVALY